jgi:hypothetical protein
MVGLVVYRFMTWSEEASMLFLNESLLFATHGNTGGVGKCSAEFHAEIL